MDPIPLEAPNDELDRKPPQYSLRSLFFATTIFGLVCGLCFALPNHVAGLAILILSPLVPGALLALAIYGSGWLRAFCIGSLVATGPQLLQWSSQVVNRLDFFRFQSNSRPLTFDEVVEAAVMLGLSWRPSVILSWCLAAVIGLLFVIIRRQAAPAPKRKV